MVFTKDVQTETHPIESFIDKDYSWNMWEWKRRACKWASIVNCNTHSTQTNYSHLRSEICSQTVEPRDKCNQTMKETGVNTIGDQAFIWGIRGGSDQQHVMRVIEKHSEKPEVRKVQVCGGDTGPCVDVNNDATKRKSSERTTEELYTEHMLINSDSLIEEDLV